jgi:hypothetical protein
MDSKLVKYSTARHFVARQRHWMLAMLIGALPSALLSNAPAEPRNLALNKPATSSSIENDDHTAAQANDGNANTCWRADDEPEGGPEWWQVDLQKPVNLSGCEIVWPYDGMNYRCRVEGSPDLKTWLLLSDQTNTKSRLQTQNLKFNDARGVRYVKITVTGFDDGCWASLSEVRIFGSESEAR